MLLDQGGKGVLEIAVGAGLQDLELQPFHAGDFLRGNRGWSGGWDTPAGADVAALRECGAGACRVILRIAGAMCAALATTETGEYAGAAGHHDGDTARLAALANCQKWMAGDCIARVTYCHQ